MLLHNVQIKHDDEPDLVKFEAFKNEITLHTTKLIIIIIIKHNNVNNTSFEHLNHTLTFVSCTP